MDFLSAMKVSATGLAAERVRVNLAASNLANAESTRGPDGEPYRRLDPVLETFEIEGAPGTAGVRVAEIVEGDGPGRRVFSPSHPDADAEGYVVLPDVNPVHEIVNLLSSQKAYDANANAIETLKTMAQRALEITR